MSQSQGGGHRDGTDSRTIDVECPKCGCPNRPEDTHCMYCRKPLVYPENSVRGFVAAYANYFRRVILTLKWRITSGRMKILGGRLTAFAVSTLLIAAGAAFLFAGIKTGGTLNWVLGALLLIYGISAIINLRQS
ncbi:MAG: hypothetical protein V3S46_00130 [Nitrospinota bacterium]